MRNFFSLIRGQLIVVIFFSLHTVGAMASDVGHGADAVVKDGKAALLDLAEDQRNYFNPLKDTGVLNLVNAKFQILQEALQWADGRSDVESGDMFGTQHISIFSYDQHLVWILVDGPLPAISDAGFISLTDFGGVVEQLAVQHDGMVWVDKKLNKKLSVENRAGLYIHENLVAAAIKSNLDLDTADGTGPLRKVVGALFSDTADSLPKDYFEKLLRELHPIKVQEQITHQDGSVTTIAGDIHRVTITNPKIDKGGVTYTVVYPTTTTYDKADELAAMCKLFGYNSQSADPSQVENNVPDDGFNDPDHNMYQSGYFPFFINLRYIKQEGPVVKMTSKDDMHFAPTYLHSSDEPEGYFDEMFCFDKIK